ncbi:unnamed protein product [Didymodactylos carnosus]|uniref:Uncharacterized protein n=1 Tax=Didymodactylos carnosus TaxID=1234261 RepID=A0A815U0Z8_9BILA|nr:unnamed protein product [Didymodactylos carnosus]CAF4368873.1 unnamed protein product [Didymodactylos carnosus]
MKEQAIILSGEINDYCSLFRDRLKNGQVLGYTDIIAKLYYDIAYVNYKYYSTGLVNNNLLSIKVYLQKCINQFDCKNQITDNINIVKQAKYFLDSVCDLYVRANRETGNNPSGNAVVLIKTGKSNEYCSFFVENGLWVRDTNGLKCVQIQNICLQHLKVTDKNGLIYKTEDNSETIEDITREAQRQRGRASINIRYDALERRKKKLEEKMLGILDTPELKTQQNSTNADNLFDQLNEIPIINNLLSIIS